MIKSKLLTCLLFLFSISIADEIVLKNGYVIENVQLDEINEIIRCKGMDIFISLNQDQINAYRIKKYDPSEPCRIVLYNKFMPDAPFQMSISTVHGEIIRGDLYKDMDSVLVFNTDYGLITISRNIIIDPIPLKYNPLEENNFFEITLENGESFAGLLISATDSNAIYKTEFGNFSILKKNIKSIDHIQLDNRSLFLGDSFNIKLVNGKSFNGVFISSTDSTFTYQSDTGVLTVKKQSIIHCVLTSCGSPLESKFLPIGNSFRVTTFNGESFDGKLISSTDSTITYQTRGDSVTVLKKIF